MAQSHRHRLEITLSGEKPDRMPIALWRHFPMDDQDPDRQAKATLAYQNQFDLDLVKVSPSSSFCLREWGVKDIWEGKPEGSRTFTHRAIHKPEDWLKLKPQDPHKGTLGGQLKCLANLQEALDPNTPFIQTIFNPLSQVKNLVGREQTLIHMRKYPEALHAGLKTIMKTTLRFIEEAKKLGIAGLFYAIQHASYQLLTEEEYIEFGRAYDLPLLEAVDDLWLNMIHLHGSSVMFDLLSDYPVQVMNWHDRETPPTLAEGLKSFPGAVCGGISRIESMELGTPEMIRKEAEDAYRQTDGKRLILGTGCVIPVTTPFGNIIAAREAAEALS
ncbi:MAG: uroporphyrinogen decarboxylase family protein [Chloroflexota bacterium]|nr:uroporphyrinogen decarboxylase family protein [Chloroflexota bacterium]